MSSSDCTMYSRCLLPDLSETILDQLSRGNLLIFTVGEWRGDGCGYVTGLSFVGRKLYEREGNAIIRIPNTERRMIIRFLKKEHQKKSF